MQGVFDVVFPPFLLPYQLVTDKTSLSRRNKLNNLNVKRKKCFAARERDLGVNSPTHGGGQFLAKSLS